LALIGRVIGGYHNGLCMGTLRKLRSEWWSKGLLGVEYCYIMIELRSWVAASVFSFLYG